VSSTSTTTYAPISAGTSHIAELWHELLDVLHEKYPAVSARMSKIGASEVEITTAEEQMHVVLPDSYKNLLRIYNADGSEEGARFCSEYFLQPLDSVVEEWLILAEALDDGAFDELEPAELGNAARAIRCVWWSKAWIPIGREPGGNLLCIDTSPDVNGIIGQVFGWERAAGPVGPFAHSVSVMVLETLNDIKSGRLAYSDRIGDWYSGDEGDDDEYAAAAGNDDEYDEVDDDDGAGAGADAGQS
jgi:cell wall assembly regulator SMI1